MLNTSISILERYWGYTTFRPLQEDIIDAVLDGKDTLALLPTGGGKSICFQVPALTKSGICIVVSPLVALINDQVNELQNRGIKAIALTGGISESDLIKLLDNAVYGKYKFLYISPERLQQVMVQKRIAEMNVNLIAVDEAHCISQWGNDFRPAYLKIKILRDIHPKVNCIALTASATPKVAEDIINALEFIDQAVFKQSFYRHNLTYEILNVEDKIFQTESILKHYKGSSIIYVRNRKMTITTAEWLKSKGIKASFYHGGLSKLQKEKHQNAWLKDDVQVMVATNAFGLGINKPNVQTVIHIQLPESLESYFQEAGRAGRNGENAYAILLKTKADIKLIKQQFLDVLPTVKDIKYIYKKLNNYFGIAYGEKIEETFSFNFTDFCRTYKLNLSKTYKALQLLDRFSIIQLSQQFKKEARIQFIVSNAQLLNYISNNKNTNAVIKSILRTYGGVFELTTAVNLNLISEKSGLNETSVIAVLNQLKRDAVLTLKLLNTDAQIAFIEPREDNRTINRIAKFIEQQNNIKTQQVESVIEYVNDSSTCNQLKLIRYFGENTEKTCEKCRICKPQQKIKTTDIDSLGNTIIKLLHTENELSSRAIFTQLQVDQELLKQTLKALLEYQKIKLTVKNTYTLI